jgi:hypothetical protein
VSLEHSAHTLGGPARELFEVFRSGLAEGVKDELARARAHVHAVEAERVEVDVEAQRRVESLDERDRTDVRFRDAREPELALRSLAA